jgi:hypothetical protein
VSEESLRELLEQLLLAASNGELEDSGVLDDVDAEVLQRCHVRSFEEAMLLTSDEGFVLHMADGSEFQVTIRQSKESN